MIPQTDVTPIHRNTTNVDPLSIGNHSGAQVSIGNHSGAQVSIGSHFLLLLLRIDTLLSVLRRTTLKNDRIRLLEEQNCNNHRNTRSDTSDVARMNTQSKHLQREMIVDLTQNASKGGSDDERGSDARIQSR